MRRIRHGTALWIAAVVIGTGAPSLADENPALVEALSIMRDRGMIDEAKYTELVAKDQQWEAAHPALLSKLEWMGDFRGRLENFWYEDDPFGIDDPDRNRARYRLRIGARAKVNEVVTAGFMLASGDFDSQGSGSGCENRSQNRSFGTGTDFNMDSICIDQAYVELNTPSRFLPEGTTIKGIFGKQANPFLWKNGKDILIWDNDITPEGVAVQLTALPDEQLSLFGNAGYFISDENAADPSSDPHVTAVQAGLGFTPLEEIETGARVSWYGWESITTSFLTTGASFGNLPPQEFSVGELAAYVRFKQIEDWPILVYGQFAQNFDAESVPGAGGDQDQGWGAGIEVGDKKKFVLIGGGYYREEANFAPAQFTDSDLFDGRTNRKGWLVWLARELWPNTEIDVTLFKDDPIEDGAAFDIETVTGTDTPSSDRYRLQTDFLVKF